LSVVSAHACAALRVAARESDLKPDLSSSVLGAGATAGASTANAHYLVAAFVGGGVLSGLVDSELVAAMVLNTHTHIYIYIYIYIYILNFRPVLSTKLHSTPLKVSSLLSCL
jgi:hypothetical protein